MKHENDKLDMEDTGKIRLEYFKSHGKACAIRMLLHHCQVPYEDSYLTREEWISSKKESGDYLYN